MWVVSFVVYTLSWLVGWRNVARMRSIAMNDTMKQQVNTLRRWVGLQVVAIAAWILLAIVWPKPDTFWLWFIVDLMALTGIAGIFRDTQFLGKKYQLSEWPGNGWLLQLWIAWMACVIMLVSRVVLVFI